MTKVPFFFPAPTPIFFRKQGLFKNPKNKAFVDWCFERCSPDERTIFHCNIKIILKPYQFIFGRNVCSEETGLTENEVRTQQERWENAGYLKKTTNKSTGKTTNRFTVYEWSMSEFIKTDHQPNNQQNHFETTNRPPTDHHNQEEEISRSKEYHHPFPSSKDSPKRLDELNEDFLKKEKEEKQIEIYRNDEDEHLVKMTQKVLDECLSVKGSLDSVKKSVEFIMKAPSRKKEISNWPNALRTWKVEPTVKSRVHSSEEIAIRLAALNENSSPWTCEIARNPLKDERGLSFYPTMGQCQQIFISFSDPEFESKCRKLCQEKKLRFNVVNEMASAI